MKRLVLFLTLAAAEACAQDYAPIKAVTTVHGDGSKSATVTNPDAGTMEEAVTDAAGKLLRKVVYQLNETGQPKNAIFYDAKGKITTKATYERDGADRIGRETIFSANDIVLRKRIYHYDAKNRVSGIDEFDSDGRPIPKAVRVSPGRPDKKKR